MNPVLLVTGPRANLEAEAAAATGATGAAVSIRCPIAGGYYDDATLRQQLADAAAAHLVPVVWLMAEHGGLKAETIDVPELPYHPDTLDACAAMLDFAAIPTNPRLIVRVWSGYANTHKNADGKTVFDYIDGPTWVAIADATAALLPASAIFSWDLDETFTLGKAPDFKSWEPTDPRFILAGVHLFQPGDFEPATLRGGTVQACVDYARQRGRHVVHLEACFTLGDILNGDAAVADYFAPLMAKMGEWGSRALCLQNDPKNFTSAQSGRYAPGAGFPPAPPGQPAKQPWKGSPKVVAFLKQKFASPLFIKQSKPGVPGITSASALQKAGIA